ncbi:biotin transporter BioY [Allorhizobium undicola]|uniref:biotin transporter BioY n=1 Tax=Allorhizobium undicola TaxID=78527 RepID=UPI0004856AEB|nr:biotin transporter BioY [Allorhizobium undicola]
MQTRDLVLIALFAAIIAALGLVPAIPLAFIPVPITAQTLGVMLAGVVLGARRGGLAGGLFLLLVAIGLPVLPGGRGGLSVFFGPTGGFLLSWPFGAFVTGLMAERLALSSASATRQTLGFFLSATLGGIGVVYLIGIVFLAAVTGMGLPKAMLGSVAFIPGDLLKAGIAALAGRAVMVGYPLLGQRTA